METITDIVRGAFANASWVTPFILFWVGAVLSLGSCSLVRIPIIVSYVGGASTSRRRAFMITLFFSLGTVLSYSVLGVIIAGMKTAVAPMVQWSRFIYYGAGIIIIAAGYIIIARGCSPRECHCVPAADTAGRRDAMEHRAGPFMLGLTFALFEAPVCPCCGPVLFIIAAMALVYNSFWFTVLCYASYALGQSFPVILVGSFTGMIKYISGRVERVESCIQFAGGTLLIALGLAFFIMG